jgi:hypothetical protein
VCNGTGRVERGIKESGDNQPFVREYEGWDEHKKEVFLRQRLNTAERIKYEKEMFSSPFGDAKSEAWPMNPKACFKMGRCPFWKLCYQPVDPEKWYEPTDEQLTNFLPREPDYVSVKQMAREEMV